RTPDEGRVGSSSGARHAVRSARSVNNCQVSAAVTENVTRRRAFCYPKYPSDRHLAVAPCPVRALQLSFGGSARVRIRKASGFALIDLIFVCGIMGLLTSIAVPSLLGAKQAAGAAAPIGSPRAAA